MATTDPWPLIHAEREALIADLGTLTGEQWATQSLCPDWTVHDPADIRKPLGIAHEYPEEALNRVADFCKGSNLIVGAKRRIDGLAMRATDTGWTTSSGPEVTGPRLSLILAMTGRSAALADLSGEGLATLRSRS